MQLSGIIGFVRCYGALLVVSGMLAAFHSAYVIAGVPQSPAALMIASFLLPVCFVTWVQFDARKRRCTPCFDFGTFVMATWAFSVPLYLIWTRGSWGVPLAAMFVALFVLPYLVAMIVWIAVAIQAA